MTDLTSGIFRVPVFKRIDDPWIGLFVLAGFTILSALIAMIVLCLLWRRHQQRTKYYSKSSMLSNAPSGQRSMPLPVGDPSGNHYESQVGQLMSTKEAVKDLHRDISSREPIYLLLHTIENEISMNFNVNFRHMMFISHFMKGFLKDQLDLITIDFYSRATKAYF